MTNFITCPPGFQHPLSVCASDDKSLRYFSEAKFPFSFFFSPKKWEIRDQDLLPAGVFTGVVIRPNLIYISGSKKFEPRSLPVSVFSPPTKSFFFSPHFFECASMKSCAWHLGNQFANKNIHCFLQVSVGGWRLVISCTLDLSVDFFFSFRKLVN